jgi:WD40 repeat protein
MPPPPAGTVAAPPRPTTVKVTPWQPGEPELPEATAPITVDQNATFDELSAQFAEVRARKQILPTGEIELEVLYDVAMRTPFRGQGDLQKRFDFFKEWSAAKPDDAAPLVLLARLHVIWGWEARGSGFAGTVSEDGFRLFGERLSQGLTYALTAEKLKPADPELYKVLVDLAKWLAGKREHVDRWVETGRQIQPNYFPLYDATSEYLLPRWHGEPGDIEEFAEDLNTAIGGDDGLEAYARIALQTNMYDSKMLYTSDYDSRKIAAGAETMGRRYPQGSTVLNFLALLAWKEQNQPLARKYLERLKHVKVDLRQWGQQQRYDAFVKFCQQEAAPDRPDLVFWPYFHAPKRMIYLDGGKRFLTTPLAKWELARFWNREDLKGPEGALPEFPDQIAGLAADSAGKRIILSAGTSNESSDVVFSVDQPEEPVIYRGDGQRLGTAISPDGKTAVTCRQNTVHLWDPATGQQLQELAGKFDRPVMQFSPDSKRLLVVNRSEVQIFDAFDGLLVRTYQRKVFPDHQYCATLNRPEQFLNPQAILGGGIAWPGGLPAIVKWNPDNDQVAEFMRLDKGRHLQVSDVSPNYVALSEFGGREASTIYLVRLSTGKLVRTINGHYSLVTQVLISPNESELATLEHGGPIRFWKIAAN